jgi:zinc D-Ala-D-Ala carboxypeptidase
MKLSEHFTLAEMTFSQKAKDLGVDNTPSSLEIDNLKKQIREVVGKPINISSGFRSKSINKLVGGSDTSAHKKGLAADINVKGMTARELSICIRDSGIVYDQLILEYGKNGSTWVHVGISDAPRKETMTYRAGIGYTNGII